MNKTENNTASIVDFTDEPEENYVDSGPGEPGEMIEIPLPGEEKPDESITHPQEEERPEESSGESGFELEMVTDRRSENTYYNFQDLNRVEAKTRIVADLLSNHGYPVTIATRTNWTKVDFPTESEMRRYLGNVRFCVTQFNEVPGIKLPVSMNGLDYIGANNIEKVLLGIEELVDQMIGYFRQCGTFNCGEGTE